VSARHPDPVTGPTRALRRLGHMPAVATTYEGRNAAADAADALAEAAARRGYDEGYAQGLLAVSEDMASEREAAAEGARRAVAALAQAVAAFHATHDELRAEVARSVPSFAFAVLEAVLGREAQLAAHPAREAIGRALALDESMQPAVIRVHPTDVEVLGALTLTREFSLVADSQVEPGGAVVDVGGATLDGQLGTALERVRQVLLGAGTSGAHDDRAA